MKTARNRGNGDDALAADLETRASDQHHQALKLWLRLLACTNRIEAAVRARLRAEFDTTLPRFDLMAQLERASAGLTMGELSRRLMVTGGNVTGITDMLEAEGLVARAEHPSDRRAFTVRLTPAGRRLFARMAAAHERWIVELLGGLDENAQAQVYRQLAMLKQHLPAEQGGGAGRVDRNDARAGLRAGRVRRVPRWSGAGPGLRRRKEDK